MLQSEDFATTWTTSASPTITTDTTAAPDGTTTADTIASTSSSSYVAQIVTFTGDGTKAYSFFIKAGTSGNTRVFLRDTTASVSRGQVDIVWTGGVPSPTVTNGSLQSLQACPNGWYRVSVTADSVVAANTNQFRIQPDNVSGTGDIIIWGFQAENGAFSTSYIPTTTTALTRSADVASVNTLSPWYNATEGTLFAEFITPQTNPAANQALASFNDTSANNRWTLVTSTISAVTALRNTSGAGLISTSTTNTFANGVVTKAALAISTGASLVLNGGTVATNASYAAPAVTQLQLGAQLTALPLNGYLRRITYYPRRLSNAELQGITA